MMKFVKKLFYFSLGPIIGSFIGFITLPLATNFISPAEYGKVSMFTLVQSVISLTIFLGMDQAYVRLYNSYSDKKKVLLNSLLIPMLLSLFVIFLFPFKKNELALFLFENSNYTLPVLLLMFTIPLIILERFLLLNIRMKEKAIQYSFCNILIKLITFIATLIFLVYLRRDFLGVIYAMIIGQILSDIILISIYRKELLLNINMIDIHLIKELIKFGLPLAPAAILGLLLNSIDRITLRELSGFNEIGLYSAANKVVNILGILQTSFTSFWVPVAYRWKNENKKNSYFSFVSEWLSFVMVIIFIIILIFKDIIIFILSDNYMDAKFIVPFLLFFPIMYTMSETTTLGIPFSNRTYLNLIVSIISLIINIILNVLLVPKIGAIGASIGTGVAYIAFFWTRTIISRNLWYNFSLWKFILYTIILIILSLLNSFYSSKLIILYNIIGLLLIFLLNIKLYLKTIDFVKNGEI